MLNKMFCDEDSDGNCFMFPPVMILRNIIHAFQPHSIQLSKASGRSDRSFFENMVQERVGWTDDFEKHYEIEKIIGEGSMGSVFVVKKREGAFDGFGCQVASCHRVKNHISAEENLSKDCSIHSSTSSPNLEVSMHTYGSTSFGTPYSYRGCCSPTKKMGGISPRYFHEDSYKFALKTIQLNQISETLLKEFRNEVEILKSLDHSNIVKPIEVFECSLNRRLFVVMELCSGGDLYSRDPYTESQAASIVGKVLSALTYMHSRNIIHRDIKYENIMFENQGPDAEVKLIDFGLSTKYLPESPQVSGAIGTIYTMSPEVLNRKCTSKADLWSTGVVAFMLLSSRAPFFGRNRLSLVSRIMNCSYSFSDTRWQKISEDAKNFIQSLFHKNPNLRPSANEAMHHTWLKTHYPLSKRYPGDAIMEQVPKTIKQYMKAPMIKKMALMLIAHNSTTSEIVDLRKVFDQYDTENNGYISYSEFKWALMKYENDYSDEDIQEMFKALDFDKNGLVNYTEFLAATLEILGYIDEERLAEAFDRLDWDNSGYISKKNLREILGMNYIAEKVDELIAEADFEQNGKISYEEFLALFRTECNVGMVRTNRSMNDLFTFSKSLTIAETSLIGSSNCSSASSEFSSASPLFYNYELLNSY
uniref:Uncharacterized protein n=1 Tax=Corethron hystrix TaxID=216773 RepID=A0A6U5FCI9_9STRA|mmetsp:Transcript_2213/g.4377  ORF Transcript_2213/g.4377 Transcript_2213/m.4377 type:complete len:645 (+) Transcript_2213:510-2444(+)